MYSNDMGKRAKHTKHDPANLNDALEHVVYEIWKYRQSAADYIQIMQAGGDAAIEFRVLHHRVLLEFFHGPAKHEDNIVAWEYIDDWQQTHDRTKIPWLDSYMTRCHTMLAHISTARSKMAKSGLKSWGNDWKIVEPHLDQAISDFLRGLSKEYQKICSQWIETWFRGHHPGNAVLKELVGVVR
jgi:hypothetical protein